MNITTLLHHAKKISRCRLACIIFISSSLFLSSICYCAVNSTKEINIKLTIHPRNNITKIYFDDNNNNAYFCVDGSSSFLILSDNYKNKAINPNRQGDDSCESGNSFVFGVDEVDNLKKIIIRPI